MVDQEIPEEPLTLNLTAEQRQALGEHLLATLSSFEVAGSDEEHEEPLTEVLAKLLPAE
jgi:hypothetical protein